MPVAELKRRFGVQEDYDDWCPTDVRPHWYKTETSEREWTTPNKQVDHALVSLEPLGERFRRLAARWSAETSHLSSVTRATAHPAYKAIVKLGWEVVPLMLQDLRNNQGFWYPALNAITGIRPFDRKDAGNNRRMTDAWISWGRKKGLI